MGRVEIVTLNPYGRLTRPISSSLREVSTWRFREQIVRSKKTPALQARLLLASGVVLQTLFTKACMGCKRFFLKERKNVMFLNKIDLP